jgi:hypothetical protein
MIEIDQGPDLAAVSRGADVLDTWPALPTARGIVPELVEEKRRRHPEHAGDIVQTPGADPVHGGLVFVDLFQADSDTLAESAPAQAHFPAPLGNSHAHMPVDGICHVRILL